MTVKRKYLIPKVADEGEDVAVDAEKFDSTLQKLLKSEPIPNKQIAGRRGVGKPEKSKD